MKWHDLSGKKAHIWQRISALYLLIYTPYLAGLVVFLQPFNSFISLSNTLIHPAILVPSLIAIILMFIHSWVGLRDILIDYTPRKNTLRWLTLLHGVFVVIGVNIGIILIMLLKTSFLF